MTQNVSLSDKYDLDRGRVYLTGIQALLRIAIDQRRLDMRAGLKTAGFFSGYRGSPLGGVDSELARNAKRLEPLDIHFRPGVNEELGATAVWGTQKVGLAGAGSDYDGVFGIWYGKAPGVDRAGDALRQANASGTARHGGALALCGDDHLAKSSVLAAQSEFALQHFEIPVFNPSDLQDVLDFGLHGIAVSRFAGNWSGMICIADTMDASGLVSVNPERLSFVLPNPDPRAANALNRPLLLGNRMSAEHLVRDIRLPAVKSYVRANRLDRVAFGADDGPVGFVTTGKAYRDLLQAFALLGVTEERARQMGVGIYKVAMPWPLETEGLQAFARGKQHLVVVEHKRAFLEPQIKDALYGMAAPERPEIFGKSRPDGQAFLSDVLELRQTDLVQALLQVLPGAQNDEGMRATAARLGERNDWAAGHAERAQRTATFCSGCPHSSSTKVPEGARAMPGIGCHAMTEMTGVTTDGQIAMGGEGVPWIGQELFSRDSHVFANMGDGTYYHSGILAIRQAVAAKSAITYKILYNDAVAMTGGQPHDGPLSAGDIVRQVCAEGVGKVVVLAEEPERYGPGSLPGDVALYHRDELMAVQEELAAFRGVSVLVFDQTCAAEKRRRRKKGTYQDPPRRLFINERVCEGCGDCSVQSTCISVEPLATPFGQKRTINQSTCNKDFSCVKGFCPSFAYVDGGALKKREGPQLDMAAIAAALEQPKRDALTATHNVLITGIGGFGVTTVGAVLAMAGHIDGLTASTLDMTGLAQKNGPVTSHVRFAPKDAAIEGPRVPSGSLDMLIASDMLVASTAESLSMLSPERTLSVVNTKVQPTGAFALKQVLAFNEARMAKILREGSAAIEAVDAAHLAETLFGDQILMNMILVGAAYQMGGLPVSEAAILQAIALNGVAVKENTAAFQAGRVLVGAPEVLRSAASTRDSVPQMSLEERIAFLAGELTQYQDAAYAGRFEQAIMALKAVDAERGEAGLRLTRLAADGLFKAMAYKDEYEVARLYSDDAYWARLRDTFEDPKKVRLMLAPPLLSRLDPATGRAKKRAFGPWVFPLLRLLSRMKRLRGTRFDPFGHTAERRAERAYMESVFEDIAMATRSLGKVPYDRLCEIAALPATVAGYGPVKEERLRSAERKRAELLAGLSRAKNGLKDRLRVTLVPPRGAAVHEPRVRDGAAAVEQKQPA